MTYQKWTTIIKPKTGWFDIDLNELWKYRDLVVMFVKRNFTTMYKQTILGPAWILINPLITTLMFTIVFGNIAKIPTEGLPPFIFYMAGNTLWSYFANCLTSTSSTFTANAGIFGKVYFPRLVTPISTVITGLINFMIQFVMLIGFVIYFKLNGSNIQLNWWLLLVPLLVIQTAVLGLGVGIIISSLTTKYRDLNVLVSFGVQLWMYATPIVYPVSQLPDSYKALIMLNPMAPTVEAFRYAFFGTGKVDMPYLLLSAGITLLVLFIGVMLFSKVEKTFMDTV
ncbi:MAG: ABC transporter permease [Clostridiaceae bacterium]